MKKALFIVILLLQLVFPAFSQQNNLYCKSLSTDDGLSQSSIACIMQDSRGFMWFGTQDGLNKYDGYKFTIYRNISSDSNSISENWVETMCEDSKGFLWFGTQLQGLNRYNRKTDRFTRYRHLGYTRINYLYRDRRNNVWVASQQGLSRIYYDEHGTEHIKSYKQLCDTLLKGSPVLSISEDRAGNLWLGTLSRGLVRLSYQDNREVFTRFYHQPDQPHSPGHDHIRAIAGDGQGFLWIGTATGLDRFDPATGQFTHYPHSATNPNSPAEDDICSLLVDGHNNLWIGTYTRGINRFNAGTGQFIRYPLNTLSDFNRIQSIYKDRQGIIWFGTLLGGINFYNPNVYRFKHYRKGDDNTSLNDKSVRGFFQDMKGNLWVATQNGGINVLNRSTDTFTYYKKEEEKSQALLSNNVRGVSIDQQQNIWVGFRKEGITRMSFTGDKIRYTHFTHIPGDSSGIPSNEIANLWLDKENNVWVCTFQGMLYRYNRINQKFDVFKNTACAANEYNDRNGMTASFDPNNGTIWVGGAAGLVRFNKKDFKIEFFESGDTKTSVLPSCNIKSMYEPHPGVVWLGTSKGLIRFNYLQKKYELYEIKHGLPSEMVYGILPDNRQHLWVSTNKGLSRFDTEKKTFRNYTTSDGLQHNEFNTGAFYKTPSGEMVFGGINGFNIFNPDSVKDNSFIPPAIITDFKIFNKSIIPSDEAVLKHHISETKELELSHEHKMISFEFVALNFANPEKNMYAYIMEGFDDNWTYTNAGYRLATYTNLPAGTYTFRVKCSNNDGLWNEKGTSIKIIVHPPFWKAGWFLVVMLSLTGCSGYIWYRVRIRDMEKQRLYLEKQVAERTQEINQQKELLEKKNEDIQTTLEHLKSTQNQLIHAEKMASLGQLVASVAHEVNSPLGAIKASVQNIRDAQQVAFKEVPLLLKLLSEQQQQQLFIDLVQAATDNHEQFSTRELRQIRKQLAADLRAQQLADPEILADTLVDMGIYSDTARFTELLSHPQVQLVLHTAYSVVMQHKSSRNIELAVERASKVVFALKNYARNDSDGTKTKASLQDNLEMVLTIYNSMLKHGIEVTRSYAPLPDITCYPDELHQVWTNLIHNAIQAMNSKGTLDVSLQEQNGCAVVTITDSGKGIPDEVKDRIFDPFFTTKPAGEGTGLGLNIVKKIIEKHQGQIEVVSEPGRTSFIVRLPYQVAEQQVIGG